VTKDREKPNPPNWAQVAAALQVLASLVILMVGVSFFSNGIGERSPGLKAIDVLVSATPLIFVLVFNGLAWVQWWAGRKRLALTLSLLPLLPVAWLIAIGIAIAFEIL
jgi:hypothetical protein